MGPQPTGGNQNPARTPPVFGRLARAFDGVRPGTASLRSCERNPPGKSRRSSNPKKHSGPPMNTDKNRPLQFAHRARSLRSLRSLQHSRRRLPRESLRTRPAPRIQPPRHPGHRPSSASGHLQRPPNRRVLRRHPRRGPARYRSEMRGPPRPRPHRAVSQLLASLRPPPLSPGQLPAAQSRMEAHHVRVPGLHAR